LPAPFAMLMPLPKRRWVALLIFISYSVAAAAQQGRPTAPADPASAANQGLVLVEKGQCEQALPLLRKASHLSDKQLEKKAGLAAVKCAMRLGQADAAVGALLVLNHDFPHDPEVLYVTTHAYSDLATRASQELAVVAPTSYQALEMNAEALEIQGKLKDAEEQYLRILADHPGLPGIHYRIGEIILSETLTPESQEEAKKEFEAELKVDPSNAGAEYLLGELARQAQQWDDSIAHFERATQLDASFAEAYRGLGMSLNASGKYSDAIRPLEHYVKAEPNDPAGHYQLAIAYARSGHRAEAEREMKLQQEADEALRQAQGKAGGPAQPPAQP
jgi:tetratricopeptide (TPR) repeat protein